MSVLLGNLGKFAEVQERERADFSRRLRFEARDLSQSLAESFGQREGQWLRLSKCGRSVVRKGGVQVRHNGQRAGVAGVSTCSSVWACPTCASKILTHRSGEIEAGVRSWLESGKGHRVAFLTLTARHEWEDSLSTSWDAMAAAYRDLGMTYGWKAALKSLGVVGQIRATEATHGENGWHVHFHVVLFLTSKPSRVDVERESGVIFREWVRALRAWGKDAVEDVQDFRVMGRDRKRVASDVANYVGLKNTYEAPKSQRDRMPVSTRLALEVTRSDVKDAKYGNRTPFAILRAMISTLTESGGDLSAVVDDWALWSEWVEGSAGRKAHVWSKGLRAVLGVAVELTDEEVAAQELGTESDALVEISARQWSYLVRNGSSVVASMLECVEAAYDVGGWEHARDACITFLNARGIRWGDVGAMAA